MWFLHSIEDGVAKRIFSDITERFSYDEKNNAKRGKPTQCIECTIHSKQSRQSGEAEERGGAAKITGKRKSVLSRGKRATRRIEFACRVRMLCSPQRNRTSNEENGYEHQIG